MDVLPDIVIFVETSRGFVIISRPSACDIAAIKAVFAFRIC